MATRSRIGILNEDGSITSIYCHWDGYPAHNGRILKEHYGTETSVREMLSLGDLSSLRPNLHPKGKHTFTDPEDGCCVFYGRDRGESDCDASESIDLQEFMFISEPCDYVYVFDANEWFCTSLYGGDRKMVRIEEMMEK